MAPACSQFATSANRISESSTFGNPNGMQVDSSGTLYVSNWNLYKITSSGSVSTFGTGLANPAQISFDTAGNLFVADYGNNRVAKIDSSGTTTSYGSGLSSPFGVVTDGSGNVNVYAAEMTLRRIRKIDSSQVVTVVDVGGFSFPSNINGLAIDKNNNLYVCDGMGVCKLCLNAGGSYTVTTIMTQTSEKINLVVDGASNVYVADRPNKCVWKISSTGTVTTVSISSPTFGDVSGVLHHRYLLTHC